MIVTIEYKDGKIDEIRDVAPMINLEEEELDLVDTDMRLVFGPVSLPTVKKVIWEND